MKIFVLLFFATLLLTLNAQTKKVKVKESQKYTYLGNKKLSEKDPSGAELDYRTAISKNNANIIPKYNLGNMYYKKENFDEALFRYQQAAKKAQTKEDKHRAYHNLGNTLMKKEEYGMAVDAYKNALMHNPSDEETRYNYILAKELSKKRNKKNKNQNKQDQNKQDQNKQDKGGSKDDKDNKDKQNKDKNNEDKADKNKENKPEGNKENNPDQQPKQQSPSQLSPEQVENLLEAVNNEERKVQNKLDGKKINAGNTRQEKDW